MPGLLINWFAHEPVQLQLACEPGDKIWTNFGHRRNGTDMWAHVEAKLGDEVTNISQLYSYCR